MVEKRDDDGVGGAGKRFPNVAVKARRTAVTTWTRRGWRHGGGRGEGGVEEEGAGNCGSLTASKSKSSG
jgi:hypothetical protein